MLADMAGEQWPKADENVRKSAKVRSRPQDRPGGLFPERGDGLPTRRRGHNRHRRPARPFSVIHASIRSHQECSRWTCGSWLAQGEHDGCPCAPLAVTMSPP